MKRSTSGVKMNWPLVAIAFAVIGVPMAVAMIQDLGTDPDEEELLARIGQVDEIAPSAEVSDDDQEARLERAEDLAGTWREPAMDQAFFDELFLGGPEETRPALRGPLAGVSWSAPVGDEVGAALTARWPRARVEVRSTGTLDRRTAAVVITFPDNGAAERILASRWGEPLLVVGTDDLARRIWSNPQQELKVVLEQHDGEARASFGRSIPAAQLIADSGRFGFEKFPILGATEKQLAARYAGAFEYDAYHGQASIECPGVEVSERDATCEIEFDGGKAVRIAMVVDHMFDPDGGPHLFAALRARLGEPRSHSSDDKVNTWTFAGGYTVSQEAGRAWFRVERVAR